MSKKKSNSYALSNERRLKAISLALTPTVFLSMGMFLPKPALAQRTQSVSCPAGTKLLGPANSRIVNGDFSQRPTLPFQSLPSFNAIYPDIQGLPAGTNLGGWTSGVPYVGRNVTAEAIYAPTGPYYPPDTSVSIVTGDYGYGAIVQKAFDGDPDNGIPATQNWLYSNGNSTGGPYTIWQQTITGLQANADYIFYAYTSNAIEPGLDPSNDPVLEFLVNGVPINLRFREYDHSDPNSGDNGVDLWHRNAVRVRTTTNQAVLELRDSSDGANGDDLALTTVGFEPCRPNIGIAETVNSPRLNPDGTYTVTYTIRVENYAPNETQYNVSGLQITNDLAATFQGATINSVTNIQSSTLTVNPNFNGNTDKNLLSGSDTLAGQGNGTITFDVTFTPGNNFGPFTNSSTVSGNHAASLPEAGSITDNSVDGTNPDVDGDRDATNNTSPTIFSIRPTPRLGVAKAALTPIPNNNGTFTIPYTIVVRNAGNTSLSQVQVVENLAQTFTGSGGFSIAQGSIAATGATANSNFNGTTDRNLLSGTDQLAAGASATITFRVNVNPGGNTGPYNNTATGEAFYPSADIQVTDESTDGNNVDPDNDGDPGNNSTPTPVTLELRPLLGVALSAGTPTNNGDGSFIVPLTVNLRNMGNVLLNNLQASSDLSQFFNGATSFSFVPGSLSASNGLTVNSNFNGTSNTNLLAGANSLAVATDGTITFRVRVVPGSKTEYSGNATANTTSRNTNVNDTSTNGTNVDPDGDNNPLNNQEPTPVSFPNRGNIRLLKRITAARHRGNSVAGLSNVENGANVTEFNRAGLRPVGALNISDAIFDSGDEIEYTIYFLSDGLSPATNVNFCDLIPEGTTYIPNSTLVQIGNAQATAGGRYLTPLSASGVPTSCTNSRVPNGAVTVDLGTLPNTGSNFGSIRFKVRVD